MAAGNKYKTEICTTIQQVLDILKPAEYEPTKGRYRELYLYRGICDASYRTLTSLQRNCRVQTSGTESKESTAEKPEHPRRKLERHLLNNFAKYAEMENDKLENSDWHKMIIGQHHGLPTRLLDWTRSPVVALHFAMTEGDLNNLDQRDCAIWRLDVKALNEDLPIAFKNQIKTSGQNVFTVDTLKKICENADKYDEMIGADKMVILEPPTIDARIENQYSFFSVIPTGADSVDDILENHSSCVTKYIISRNLRWQVRDMLDLMNVNERIIYPGLDGIAKWLARYYYPRELTRFRIEKKSLADADADVIAAPFGTDDKYIGAAGAAVLDAAGRNDDAPEKKLSNSVASGKYKFGSIIEIDSAALSKKVRKLYFVGGERTSGRRVPEDFMLETLYNSVLEKAVENGYHSVAFPLMGIGSYGYTVEKAWEIAINTCRGFLDNYQKIAEKKEDPLHYSGSFTITVCVTGERYYQIGKSILNGEDPSTIKQPVNHKL